MILFQASLDIYFIYKEHRNFLKTQNLSFQPNIIGFILHLDTPKVRMRQNMTDFPTGMYSPLLV